MRRYQCFLLLVGLGLLFGPCAGPGQSGGGADQGGATDLKQRWQQLAGNKATWRRADVTDPLQLFVFDLVADRVQATNGEISREQFLGMTPRGAGLAKAGDRRAPAPATPPGGLAGAGPHATAEAEFHKLDADGDGLLNNEEMDDGLRAERDKWDTNQDGFIDLNEYRKYHKARRQQEHTAVSAGAGKSRRAPPAPGLPPNLPPWFQEYDTDGDGQVGLYEWKAAGQPVARFLALDANGDGFLTPDEVLWATRSDPAGGGTKPGE